MRDTEKRGNLYLSKRNQITGRKDFLTEEIKKQLFNFSTLSLEEFKARAEKFEAIKSLILAKKMEKYFFSKIRERDLGKFLEKFNDFGSDDEKIVSLLAMFGEEKKALRILTTPSDTSPTPEPVPELSEQEKIEKKQKLDQAKSQLLSKLTNSNA